MREMAQVTNILCLFAVASDSVKRLGVGVGVLIGQVNPHLLLIWDMTSKKASISTSLLHLCILTRTTTIIFITYKSNITIHTEKDIKSKWQPA